MFSLFCWSFQLLGGETPKPDLAKFRLIAPCETLTDVARSNQIPLAPLETCTPGKTLNLGDSISGLVTLCEKGGKRTQWLLFMRTSQPDAKEANVKPSKPFLAYTALGSKFEFVPSPAWVDFRTLGPFAANSSAKPLKAKDQPDRFTLDQASLSLGLDRGAATLSRLKAEELKQIFHFQDQPFSEMEIRTNRAALGSRQPSVDEERAVIGSVPALFSYFHLVQHTRGLESILYQMIEKPSLWSIIRHGIRVSLTFQPENIRPADSAEWGLAAGTPAYHLPMSVILNDRLVLLVTLVVTTPQPPLLACGGVVGLLAEKPTDPEHYLTLRIVQAHRASGESGAAR